MKMRSLAMISALVAGLYGVGMNSAVAQSGSDVVTLRSFDGFTQLRGRLVDFDGSRFTIETVLGIIQVDALQVNCEGDACPQNLMFGAEFGIYGSNTIGGVLMPALIQGYADKLDATLVTELASNDQESMLRIVHNDGREMAAIDLKSPGSTFGYSGLAEAKADIGMSARRARDRDVNLLNAAGMEDPRDTENEHVIGLDGLIVIVNAQNPIQSMSLEELGLVFAGIVTNWSQLGGPDAPIKLHSRDEESGTFQSFGSLVLSPQNALLSPTAIQYGDNNALSDAVAGDTGGIGVTGIANQRAAKAIPIRQECGILSYPTS
ncbi:MAG: substrate-binding domain-containing protein, partial [Pseudomonadota bacterium]